MEIQTECKNSDAGTHETENNDITVSERESSARQDIKALKQLFSRRTAITLAVIILIFITVTVPLIAFPGKIMNDFKSAFSDGRFDAAASVYYDNRSDGSLRKRMDKYIINAANSEFSKYKSGSIAFDELNQYITGATKAFDLSVFSVYTVMLDDLSKSYSCYCEGQKNESENKIGDALICYMNVSEDDPEYLNVQSRISKLKETYKPILENNLTSYEASEKYEDGLSAIDQAEKIYGQDSYSAQRERFLSIKSRHEKETARNSQIICSYDAHIAQNGSGNDDLLAANVKNNDKKTVEMYIVAFCAYDKNGEIVPLASKEAPNNPTPYVRCRKKNASLEPGQDTGSGFGWAIAPGISENISSLDSCVISAEYEDGTIWNNPYYKYWCDDKGIVDIQE